MSLLPPFPTDDGTLDLLSQALDPDPEVFDRSSVSDFLIFMSSMGGSDTDAVEESFCTGGLTGLAEDLIDDDTGMIEVNVMRDPQYHEHDVLRALIREVRVLRHALGSRGDTMKCSCTMLDSGSPWEPPEWEQNPYCFVHPDMPYIMHNINHPFGGIENCDRCAGTTFNSQ